MFMKAKLYVNHHHETHEILIAPFEPEESPLCTWSVRFAEEAEPFAFWEPIPTESLAELAADAMALAEEELNERSS